MSNFKLNLPTDIPWERICVTEDMIDKVVCDNLLPAKWQTSLAVFKYLPDDEFQLYPNYKITYLKVTATITGYQPLDKEVQGNIDWDGVDVSTIPGLTDLLNSYNPCHGAVLQVVVGPKEYKPKLSPDKYPFFLDFEPKKRELYELATDTKEKQSRSIESLNITKSSGNTQSMEILDIDMGGGGFGAQASYAGTGGGFSYTAPNGQWGTKRLNADESLTSRSSDVGQEKRETFSYSTQISQMYHLLDSYHLGTDRVIFFIQPRPHTLEEPSGFVRGPRPVDGIQEFFMVVAQPKDQKEFCVSLRLDTSHLTKIPIMEYDRRTVTSGVVSASVPTVYTLDDITANFDLGEKIVGRRACLPWPADGVCWDVHYQCFTAKRTNTETIPMPLDYVIESYDNIINESDHGSSTVFISGDNTTATISVEANGRICMETGEDVCVDCPDLINEFYGHARRQVSFNLRSKEPIKQVGEEEVLMITTRGLCCCSSDEDIVPADELVAGIKRIPDALSVLKYLDANVKIEMQSNGKNVGREECLDCDDKSKAVQYSSSVKDPKLVIRMANELSNYIKTETIKSLNDPTVKFQKYADTDFFAKQLEYKLTQSNRGRRILKQNVSKDIPKDVLVKFEKYFKKAGKEITRRDLLSIRGDELARVGGLKKDQIQKMKLSLLGVKFNPNKPKSTGSRKHESN